MPIPLTASLFWCFLAIFVVFAFVLGMRAWRNFGLSLVFALGTTLAGFPVFAMLWVWSMKADRPVFRTVFGTFLIFYTACGLSLLKGANLLVYACVEIAFSLSIAAQTMYNLMDEIAPIQLLSIVAAMYLFVRGLDDVDKYFADRKGKPKKTIEDYLTVLHLNDPRKVVASNTPGQAPQASTQP
jgi:hypothetical protein